MTGAAVTSNFTKRCEKCNAQVHFKSKKCENCGGQSPWQGPVKLADAYVVLEPFSFYIGISLTSFRQGQVITDTELIRLLVAGDCPIEPKSDEHKIALCPHCNETFVLKPQAPAPQFSPEIQEKIARLGVG